MPIDSDRMTESLKRLVAAFWYAFGVYQQQECTKDDKWRDQSQWELLQHARKEIEEISKSTNARMRLHNCADLVGQSLIVLAEQMNQMDMFEDE